MCSTLLLYTALVFAGLFRGGNALETYIFKLEQAGVNKLKGPVEQTVLSAARDNIVSRASF